MILQAPSTTVVCMSGHVCCGGFAVMYYYSQSAASCKCVGQSYDDLGWNMSRPLQVVSVEM